MRTRNTPTRRPAWKAAQHTTTLTYDIAGRKLAMDDTDMGYWTYSYDAMSNLTQQIDARGCVTSLAYDNLNRMTGKGYSYVANSACQSLPATPAVAYTYDETNNGNKGIGRRTAMSDGSGSSTWKYDYRGRVTTESKTISGAGTFNFIYTYNSADLLTNVQHPSDTVGGTTGLPSLTYSYLPQMTLNAMGSYVTGTSYDEAGRMVSRTLANGQTQTYTYYGWTETAGDNDRGGLLKSIQTTGLQNLTYEYDPAGNITEIYDGINTQYQAFTYDELNRLESANATGRQDGLYNETYGYNASTGNLSSKAGNSYTYGDTAHPHAATQLDLNIYAYDPNGNMTTRTIEISTGTLATYTLGYDAEGRLTSVSGATTAAFVYDGDGNRVKSTIGTQTVAYIGPRVEYNLTTNTMTRYYLFGSERIAMRVLDKWKTPNETNNVYYTLSDHLGSASVMTDTSGNRKTEYRYTAWGEDRYTYIATSTVQTAYQYTGQRNDDMGGLLYYNARWYDPSLSRFAQADTIIPGPGNPLAWDRYAGMANNPLKYNDPSGHFWREAFSFLRNVYEEQLISYSLSVTWNGGEHVGTATKINDTTSVTHNHYIKAPLYMDQIQGIDLVDPAMSDPAGEFRDDWANNQQSRLITLDCMPGKSAPIANERVLDDLRLQSSFKVDVVYWDDQNKHLRVGAFNASLNAEKRIIIDDPNYIINPGDSGGGIFYKGQLIGNLWYRLTQDDKPRGTAVGAPIYGINNRSRAYTPIISPPKPCYGCE
jgi:RHS repeat-associated protein